MGPEENSKEAKSPVAQINSQIDNELDYLDEVTSLLERRLQPVLYNGPQMAATPETDSLASSSPLGTTLAQHVDRLVALRLRLARIIDRVEV